MPATRIALFLLDRQNDYQALMQADCERVARRYDLLTAIHFAERSAEVQLKQIRTVLQEREALRPRAILVCPVSEVALMPLVHEAARAGVSFVILSRWSDAIHEFRRQYSKLAIFAVLPDHVEIGRIQGRQLRLLLAPGDELVYIQGPMSTYSTRRRRMGLEKELGDKHDFRWTHLNSDWSVAGGEAAMKSWVMTFTMRALPEFVIAAQNDSMAAGARQAVMDFASSGGQVPHRKLRVLGCDGSPAYGQRLVTTGQLQATVVIPPLASRAVEEVLNFLRTGTVPQAEINVGVHSHPDLDTLSRGGSPPHG